MKGQTNSRVRVVANHALDCVHYLFAVISIREICRSFIQATILVILIFKNGIKGKGGLHSVSIKVEQSGGSRRKPG